MWVKTRGGAGACSATAETVSEVNGSRFFCKIETTSTAVQLHKAISTNSIGLGPPVCAASASTVTWWPLWDSASYCCSCFHVAMARILSVYPVGRRSGIGRLWEDLTWLTALVLGRRRLD